MIIPLRLPFRLLLPLPLFLSPLLPPIAPPLLLLTRSLPLKFCLADLVTKIVPPVLPSQHNILNFFPQMVVCEVEVVVQKRVRISIVLATLLTSTIKGKSFSAFLKINIHRRAFDCTVVILS